MFFGKVIYANIYMVLYWTSNCINRKNTAMNKKAGLVIFRVCNNSADCSEIQAHRLLKYIIS